MSCVFKALNFLEKIKTLKDLVKTDKTFFIYFTR